MKWCIESCQNKEKIIWIYLVLIFSSFDPWNKAIGPHPLQQKLYFPKILCEINLIEYKKKKGKRINSLEKWFLSLMLMAQMLQLEEDIFSENLCKYK